MNIDFILDITCLWSYIAWRQLRTALKENAARATISPFFINGGSFFPGFDIQAADRARMLEEKASPFLREAGISVNFDAIPELSSDLSLPCELVRTAFSKKKYNVLDDIFSAFFSFGKDVSVPETIRPIAEHYELTLNAEHRNPRRNPLPANMPEGLRAVPCLIFDHTTIIFGVQSIPCLKNMICLSNLLKKENVFSEK
ncbi:MAG: DsbA family protein [Alphaproteobacteria bacterium]|nr:DsbA family protein [Alphaproteobacteria bacterium]